MNIVTICSTSWLDHLDRFIYRTRLSMYLASLYVLVVYDKAKDPIDRLAKLRAALLPHVQGLMFTTVTEMPGRLMFYDAVRTTLLDIFKLPEALYLDVDADILQDLSDIPLLNVDAPVIASVDPMPPMEDTRKAFEAYNIPKEAINYQNGLLYMRRSFKQEFEQIMSEDKIQLAGSFMAGSAIWNVILHRHKAPVVPLTHYVCWQHSTAMLHSKIIHFNGPIWQKLRLHCTYPTVNPNTLQFNPQPTGRFILKDI